jgi:RND superfamily putative drug exporter
LRTDVQAFVDGIRTLAIPVEKSEPVKVGDFVVGGRSRVLPAEDGRAQLAVVNFDLERLGTMLADGESAGQQAIEAIRRADRSLAGDGVRVYVAGPAAQISDLVKVFGGIDGILLLVTLLTVLVILLVVYRSPVVSALVLLSAGCAYVLAAATDYALLLVARYREELRRHDDRYEAMWLAWRRTLEPVAASAGTVIVGLLCLLLSGLGPTRSLGSVGAIGVASALLASLTFLPAVLVIPGRNSPGEHGRWVFWPLIPHLGSEKPETASWVGRSWPSTSRAVRAVRRT